MRCVTLIVVTLLQAQIHQAPPRPPQPHSRTTCVAHNVGVVVVDYQTKKEVEKDDWYCDCKIEVDDKQIWTGTLTLAHPATLHEATDAIEEFRTKRAPQIIREYKK